jgi:ribosomal protein L12E/L44/L45/RPP1/RPP2
MAGARFIVRTKVVVMKKTTAAAKAVAKPIVSKAHEDAILASIQKAGKAIRKMIIDAKTFQEQKELFMTLLTAKEYAYAIQLLEKMKEELSEEDICVVLKTKHIETISATVAKCRSRQDPNMEDALTIFIKKIGAPAYHNREEDPREYKESMKVLVALEKRIKPKAIHIIRAVDHGHLDLVLRWSTDAKYDVNKGHSKALMKALQMDDLEMAKILLRGGYANPNEYNMMQKIEMYDDDELKSLVNVQE